MAEFSMYYMGYVKVELTTVFVSIFDLKIGAIMGEVTFISGVGVEMNFLFMVTECSSS